MTHSSSTLPRTFGLWRSIALVTGNIVGSGLLMLPASLGVYGTLGLLGWGLTALGALCLALVFARLSQHYPYLGGPYAYSRTAFGDFIGFQMAWSYWVGTWGSNCALATTLVSYLAYFWPGLTANPFLAFGVAFSSVWLFTGINIIGIRLVGILQVFLTFVKLVPLFLIGIFGLFYVDSSHYLPLNPSQETWGTALSNAAVLTLFSFLGLESATIPANQVKEPRKTIPRATLLGTLLAAFIYIWLMTVILGVLSPQQLSHSPAPFAEVGRLIFGEWAGVAIAASAVISVIGSLNGWILLQGQIPLAAAQDHLFPKVFQKVTSQGTPALGLILSACLMSGMLYFNYQQSLVDQFTLIVTFSTFAVLLPYLYSCVAELILLQKEKQHFSRLRFLRSSVIAFLGFIYTLFVIAGAGQTAVYWGMLFVFSGLPFYAFIKKQGREHPK